MVRKIAKQDEYPAKNTALCGITIRLILCLLFLVLFSLFFTSCPNPWMERAFGLITITFNTNGGSFVPDQKLLRGEAINRPGNPVREGHVFIGWFEDNDIFELEWNFEIVPNEELTLYAKWIKFAIDVDPVSFEFEPAVAGYGTIAPLDITITNAGDMSTGNLFISLSGSNSDCFSLSVDLIDSIGVGSSAAFTVVPNTGLLRGYYTAEIIITGDNDILKTVSISFIVGFGPITGIEIKTPPNLIYSHGDSLDLSGLIITLIFGEESEDITFAGFANENITVNHDNGMTLLRLYSDNQTITVSVREFTQTVGVLTVNKKALEISGAEHTRQYDTTTSASGVSVTLSGQVGNEIVSADTVTAQYGNANAGTVIINITNVTLTGADADNYTVTLPVVISVTGGITKADGAAIDQLTVNDSSETRTITASAAPVSDTGQEIEYAINETGIVPDTGWVDSGLFDGLEPDIPFYIFARTKENNNYLTGEVKVSAPVTLYLETVSITLTIEQITDINVLFESIIISRTGVSPYLKNKTVELDGDELIEAGFDITGIKWEIYGPANTVVVSESGVTFTLDAADIRYNTLGGHTLKMTIERDNVPYMVNIPFTIVN